VEEGNTAYDSRDSCNAIIETASNTLIAGCMNTKVPASITCTLHVPIGSKEAYANTEPWSKFKNIVAAAAQTTRHPVQSRTHKQKGARKGGSNTKKSK
jgi:hypothetical protein